MKKWMWKLSTLLVVLGLIVVLFCPGYDALGLVIFGCGWIYPCFWLLDKIPSRKWRKGGRMTAQILMALVVIAMAITLVPIVSSSRGTPEPTSDYLIVLGAGVNGTVPSRSLRERLDAALTYLQAHPTAVAIVSGGQGRGEEITEAECMKTYLLSAGIDENRVWKEEQATNTLENLQYSLDIIQSQTGQRPQTVAVVSSEYHLHRAGLFAQQLGLEAELVPAKTSLVLLRWNYYLREIVAVWYYSIF